MDNLRRVADDRIWHDGEQTKLTYMHPILACASAEGWLGIAKSRGLLQGIPEDELYSIDGFWCARSPQSHVGPFLNAIDFLVPDGTSVLAAQDGTIINVTEHFREWGDDERFRDTLNFVDIQHESGEISEYCHLKMGSVSARGLRVGSRIKQGQVIATVGKTGWTDRDHLHFVVYRLDNGNYRNPLEEGRRFKSLKIRFA